MEALQGAGNITHEMGLKHAQMGIKPMKRRRLTHTLFTFMAILGILGVIGSAFTWGGLEYFRHQKENAALRQNYIDLQKGKVKRRTIAALRYVMYKKNLAERRLKKDIKQRTYEAHATATHIYNENVKTKSKAEITKLIHSALFAASWDNGEGYYFAEDMKGTERLNRNNPELEGKSIWDLQDCNGVYIMREIIDVVKKRGEGFCTYHWNKPSHPGLPFAKHSFVKYFKPLDWVIGTGKYLKDQEKVMKKEILDYFEATREDEGYVFLVTYDGVSLSYPAKNQNVLELTDRNGKKFIQALIHTAKKGGGFVSYVMPQLGEEIVAGKISYCGGIDDWGWLVGSGVHTDAIEKEIILRSQNLRSNFIKKTITSVLLMSILLVLALFLAQFISRRLSCDLDAFSDFFVKAADKSLKIPQGKINFREFVSMAESANQMIEDKVKAETEKQQLEKQLEIAHKMEAIGLLAGGVAHDLNNTLSAIINVPEFILMKMKDDDPFKESIELILEAGKRASAIVHDLQTMNRGVVCEHRVIDLNELIKNAVASVEFKDLRENFPEVELVTKLADEQLLIDCSVPHINKLLLNLASNGMEAITNSGELSIVASSHTLDSPIFGYSKIPAGDYALLEVKDNGSGISPEDLQRIFEPFYSKKVLGRSGTGLGLAIVWSTVDNHHAFIRVESSESGTVFSVYFPKMDKIPPSQQMEVPADLAKGKDQTILVVDDEEIQHKTVSTMLEELGYKSESVFSGEEALKFLKNKTVDVVLLDMMLGTGMNGRETYKAILRDHPEQKAIIATGYAMNDDVKETLAMGVCSCLHKPYLLKDLANALHSILG